MLHKPDAAYITQAGRCYLQVGNDEIYELFQSGWSGAPYDDSNEGGKQEILAECPMAELSDYAITLRSMTQGRGSFVSKFERYDEAPAPVQEKVIAENKARMEALNKD